MIAVLSCFSCLFQDQHATAFPLVPQEKVQDWKRAPSEKARNRTGSELSPGGFIGKRKEVSKLSLEAVQPDTGPAGCRPQKEGRLRITRGQ